MIISAPQQESRGQKRYPCTDMYSQVRTLIGTKVYKATVRDLSRSGIGLVINQTIVPNKPLLIEIFDLTNTSSQTHATWAIHCTPRDDGQWLVGCSFIHLLTEKELASLMGEKACDCDCQTDVNQSA